MKNTTVKIGRWLIIAMPMITHEAFVDKINSLQPNIIVKSLYTGANNRVECLCNKCDYEWTPYAGSLSRGAGCPSCNGVGKRDNARYEQDLRNIGSQIINVEPYIARHTKIKHKCLDCEHEWDTAPNHILEGTGCPACTGFIVVVGRNDLWTTHPIVAEMLVNRDDGYKVSSGSHKELTFACPCCGTQRIKTVSEVIRNGLSCSGCGDGKSYPNKLMFNILNQTGVFFENEKSFGWSERKLYDFYIPEGNIIIEMHGAQHYSDNNLYFKGKSFEEVRQNDVYKETLALQNGVLHYIIIDCLYSRLGYIKDNILNSVLGEMVDLSNVDWNHAHALSLSSNIKAASNLWNKGLSTAEIMNQMKLCRATVCSYLKKAAIADWCDYVPRKVNTNKGVHYG